MLAPRVCLQFLNLLEFLIEPTQNHTNNTRNDNNSSSPGNSETRMNVNTYSTPNLLRAMSVLALLATVGCVTSEGDDTASNADHDSSDGANSSNERRPRIRRDADGDGYVAAPWGRDCNDTLAAVHPGAGETCATDYDDDCDGSSNELDATSCTDVYLDSDGDGFGDAASSACYCFASGSFTSDSTDCDDAAATVFPAAAEIVGDGIDQDCDGIDVPATDTAPPTDTGPSTGAPPLYGFWGLNDYQSASGFADVESRFGMQVFQVACSTPNWCVNTLLPMVKSAGIHVTFRMTSGPSGDTTSGNFDIAKWKAQLPAWSSYDVQSYIDDGTYVGHMLLDDIHNYSGRDPTGDELDEMARYSKSFFPGLMTYVRERATEMPVPSSGQYDYVDACVNQYQWNHGEIHDYATEQQAQALALNLGTIEGLNIADGGDGRSGQPGWRSGFWAMSAEEITEYGNVLAAIPEMGMFLNWEYDGSEAWSDGTIGDTYFNQADKQAALADLAVVVGSHAPVTLLKP